MAYPDRGRTGRTSLRSNRVGERDYLIKMSRKKTSGRRRLGALSGLQTSITAPGCTGSFTMKAP